MKPFTYGRRHKIHIINLQETIRGLFQACHFVRQLASTGAQILFRPLPLGFSFAYIPKGPVGPDWAGLWPVGDQVCRQKRAVLLKVEPDQDEPVPPEMRRRFPGFHPNADPIQPRRTFASQPGRD